MALNSNKPAQFNQKAEFGITKSVLNKNTGNYVASFVPQFTLWCRHNTRSFVRQYQNNGHSEKDTPVIVVRHSNRVTDALLVRYRTQLYKIADISVDDSNIVITYDYLTLEKTEKVG
jgi:SPP1 family predicted phage head-tail adaptor